MENNSVHLVGTILSVPTCKRDDDLGEFVLYFTLAVERKGDCYEKGYNFDKYNYFYCCMLERNFNVSVLKQKHRHIAKLARVEVNGFLDNRVSNKVVAESKSKHINYRTLNAFVSTINVMEINKVNDERPEEEIKAEKLLLLRIRQTFGSDTSISVDKNAFEKDYFGFDKNDDLPDY